MNRFLRLIGIGTGTVVGAIVVTSGIIFVKNKLPDFGTSTGSFDFEVKSGTITNPLLSGPAEAMDIINRSQQACINAKLIANTHYSVPLEKTASGFPTGSNVNSKDIQPGEKVRIVNPRLLNYHGDTFDSRFRDSGGRGLLWFSEIRELRISCDGGSFDARL